MRSSLLGICALISVEVACGNAAPQVLLPDSSRTPADIRQACTRTEVRCSSCHTLERVLTSQRRGFQDWHEQVTRMRLMRASGISEADSEVIVRCLVYRDSIRGD